MKILKNRVFLAAICAVLAVACIFAYSGSVKSEANMAQVARFTCNVTKGEKITDAMVETATVGGYHLSPGLAASKGAVVGKYAATDFSKGDLIMSDKLSDTIQKPDDRLSQLDGNRVAVSVSVKDFSDAVSDKLRSGDIVSIINHDKSGTAIPPELTYVEVLAVTDGKGVDKQQTDSGEEKEAVKTVTLLVTPAQAVKLTGYEDNSEIHFALVYRGDSKTAQKFLDKQSEVLKNGTGSSNG